MPEDIVIKVTRLIALAESPNENEARNAAHKACALIRQHKLVISISKPAGSRWPAQTPPSATRDPWPATGRRPETRTYKVCKGCLNVRIEWSETYCSLCKNANKWVGSEGWMRDRNGNLHDIVGGKRPTKTKPKKVKIEYDKVWFAECATCGGKGPNGKTSEEADVKALEFGFRIVEDKPMCPGCIYRHDERTGTKTP